MVGKEGRGFRDEVADFVCLSPGMVIVYRLKHYYAWMRGEAKKVLTERNVIGTAMEVHADKLRSAECGVEVVELAAAPPSPKNTGFTVAVATSAILAYAHGSPGFTLQSGYTLQDSTVISPP